MIQAGTPRVGSEQRQAFEGDFPGNNSYTEGSRIHYYWFEEIVNCIMFSLKSAPLSTYITHLKSTTVHTEHSSSSILAKSIKSHQILLSYI